MLKRLLAIAMVATMATQGGVFGQDGENSAKACESGKCAKEEAIEVACSVLGIDLVDDDEEEVIVQEGRIVIVDGKGKKHVVDAKSAGKGTVLKVGEGGEYQVVLDALAQQDEGKEKKSKARHIVIGGKDGIGKEIPKDVIAKLKEKGIVFGAGDGKFEFKWESEDEDSSPSDKKIEIHEDAINKKVIEKIHAALEKHEGKLNDKLKKQIHEKVIQAIKVKSADGKGKQDDEGNIKVEVIVDEDAEGQQKLHQILRLHSTKDHNLKVMPKVELKGHGVYQFKSDDGKSYKVIRTQKGKGDGNIKIDSKIIELQSGDGKAIKVVPHGAHGVMKFETKDGKTVKVVPHEVGQKHEVFEFKSDDGKTIKIVPHAEGHLLQLRAKSQDAKENKVIVVEPGKNGVPHVIRKNVGKVVGSKGGVVVAHPPHVSAPGNLKQIEKRLDALEKKLDKIMKLLMSAR